MNWLKNTGMSFLCTLSINYELRIRRYPPESIRNCLPGECVSMQFRIIVVLTTLVILACFPSGGFSKSEFLKAVPDLVDFGVVEEGEPAAAAVTIQNTGTTTVEITNVRTS